MLQLSVNTINHNICIQILFYSVLCYSAFLVLLKIL